MNFKLFESTDQTALKALAWHVLSIENVGPFHESLGEKWHKDLIVFLRTIGWNEYADDLELYRPTEDDRDYSSSIIPNPYDNAAGSMLNQNRSAKLNFTRSSQGYHLICDDIIKKIDGLIEDRDWWQSAISERY